MGGNLEQKVDGKEFIRLLSGLETGDAVAQLSDPEVYNKPKLIHIGGFWAPKFRLEQEGKQPITVKITVSSLFNISSLPGSNILHKGDRILFYDMINTRTGNIISVDKETQRKIDKIFLDKYYHRNFFRFFNPLYED
jgi:hypothetical protein